MIITLTGNNQLSLRRRLDELAGSFTKQHGELALEKLDAAEINLETVLDAVQSLPFLSAKKMVILRQPSANKEISENIEQIISSISNSTDMIIYEPEPDKRTAYFKTLQRGTRLEQFSELDAPGLARWLAEEAKLKGGHLSLADANYLVERAGANQQLLSNELEKLVLYNRQITRNSIDLLTEATPQGKIFDLLDAAFGGDKQKALRLYKEQRTQKVEPQAILALIIWQLHLIALVKLAAGRPAASISADTGIKPYPINKAASLAKKITPAELKRLVSELLDIDVKSKNTSLDLDEALQTYITTL